MRVAAIAFWLFRHASLGSAQSPNQAISIDREAEASFLDASHAVRNGLMRREIPADGRTGDGGAGHRHHGKTGRRYKAAVKRRKVQRKAKRMFKEMDMDKDGVVSMAEVEEKVHRSGVRQPQNFHDMLLKLDLDNSGVLDFKEFKKALFNFYHVRTTRSHQGGHSRHHRKRSNAHPVLAQLHSAGPSEESVPRKASKAEHLDRHKQGMQYQENKEKDYAEFIDTSGKVHVTTKTKTHTGGNKVSCGGHVAISCAACTTTAFDGSTTTDHGAEWCNGDCVYSSGACHDSGTVVADTNVVSQGYATTEMPDLLNPNLTSADNRTINAAAEAAIREENMEAAENERKQEEDMQGKKFSMKKFWLIMVITMSVILGLCAICSLVAVAYLCMKGDGKKEPAEEGKEEGEEAEEAEEAEEDEEAEADDGATDADA